MSLIPKAILYYNSRSVWASAALLALEEKGYGQDEVELKSVDIGKAENLSLACLRLNPKGTIPTLVVPLENTLAPELEHRFKAVTDTKSIVDFLDKSRSAISKTNTTSSAPAPALAPATIALSSTSKNVIDLLHSEDADPNKLAYHKATDVEMLKQAGPNLTAFLTTRRDAIARYISESAAAEISASDKTRKLWAEKKAEAEEYLSVFANTSKSDSDLPSNLKEKRDEFLKTSESLWSVKLKRVFVALDKELIGPFVLGDQLSVADVHLAAWLSRIAYMVGGTVTDTGDEILGKIERKISNGFTFPKDFQAPAVLESKVDPSLQVTPGAKRAKLAAFWDDMTARPSWKKVYADGLH
ncbi:hypothetical protein BD410DRAFT_824311 [Rickenella mellea]|uniref:GST N-terminal domain-containing protein n=1 Tax=Rickenella mellea TaxID=50990 RepID=A0A4Y7QMM4_9AGAM|nr:hypothetical protein BD410DRAFT_824311 [Rickenella mellea]